MPLLTGLGKLSQHRAHGTSLALVLVVASVALARYAWSGAVDWKAGILIGVAAVFGVLVGTRVMRRLAVQPLRLAFGCFLVLVAIRMLWS